MKKIFLKESLEYVIFLQCFGTRFVMSSSFPYNRVCYTHRIRVTSLRKLWRMLMLSSLLSRGIRGKLGPTFSDVLLGKEKL